MDNKNIEIKNTEERREEKKSKKKTNEEKQNRIIIDKDANQELEKLIEKIKENNDTIKVTKSDIASFVLKGLQKYVSDADIRAMKSIYFDENKVLQSLLRKSLEGIELPHEMKCLVRELYGLGDRDKKRPNRNRTEAVLENNVTTDT